VTRTATGLSSSSGDSGLRLLGRGGVDDRSLYLAHIDDLDQWPLDLDKPQAHFVVLLVMDASSVERDRIASLARKLMDQGMVYLHAWGSDSRRVHGIFDEVEEDRGVSTDDAFVVTDDHEGDDLDDALWDAVMAPPTDAYIDSCRAVVAIVVDQSEWKDRVKRAFEDFDSFNEEILDRDFPDQSAGERSLS
jgi:hypothetical protein